MKTSESAAVAAVNSVDPDRWQTEFSAVVDRIAPRFARYEPLRHSGELMAGLVSGLDKKNCWTIAEHRGACTPDGLQHLLARASWDADDVRDDLCDYVVDAFGDSTGCCWSPTTPSPPCWPGHDGDDDTNIEHVFPTTDAASINDLDLRLQY